MKLVNKKVLVATAFTMVALLVTASNANASHKDWPKSYAQDKTTFPGGAGGFIARSVCSFNFNNQYVALVADTTLVSSDVAGIGSNVSTAASFQGRAQGSGNYWGSSYSYTNTASGDKYSRVMTFVDANIFNDYRLISDHTYFSEMNGSGTVDNLTSLCLHKNRKDINTI